MKKYKKEPIRFENHQLSIIQYTDYIKMKVFAIFALIFAFAIVAQAGSQFRCCPCGKPTQFTTMTMAAEETFTSTAGTEAMPTFTSTASAEE